MTRRRVLVTREEAEPLAGFLRALDLEPLHLPLFTLEATGAPPPTDRPGLLLVSSAAALRFRPDLAAYTAGAPAVAVGAATAEALRAAGIEVLAVGRAGGAEALRLLPAIAERGPGASRWAGASLWYVGAEEPSAPLREALAEIPHVHWSVYRQRGASPAALHTLRPFEAVTFASPSAVEAFAEDPHPAAVITIGETTAAAARARGWSVHAMAEAPSLRALAEASARLLHPAAGHADAEEALDTRGTKDADSPRR